MIVWLASYPKSGNTLLRSILSTYFYSSDGIYDFNYTYLIEQFPTRKHFEKFGIDSTNEQLVFKNFIKVQEMINSENKKIKFLKTHSQYFHNGDFKFTNGQNSLCAIYIVRDPRNVVKSYAHHSGIDIQTMNEVIIDRERCTALTEKHCKNFIGSWGSNYNSWKILGKKVLIIKYEDLILKKKTTLLKVFKFLDYFGFNSSNIDMIKLNKVIKTTEFEKMKELEKKKTFIESQIHPETGKRIPFFNLGSKNDWRKDLDEEIRKNIEDTFEKEMKELGYL